MKIVEKIAIGLAAIGFILKLFLFPGTDIILTLSLGFLSLLYLLTGFSISKGNPFRISEFSDVRKQMNGKQIFFLILFYYGLAVLCMGILFKLMFFPSSQLMLLIGSINVVIVSIFLLIEYRKTGQRLFFNGLCRAILWGTIGILLYLTPDLTIKKLYYRNYPAYIEAYQKHIENPDNEELTQKMNEEYYKITLSEKEYEKYIKEQNQ